MYSEIVFFDRSCTTLLPRPRSLSDVLSFMRPAEDASAANDDMLAAALDDNFPWHRIRRLTRK